MWLEQREAILKQLRSLHPRAEELVGDLEIIDEAISKSRSGGRSTKYVGYGPNPIKAIVAALHDIGEPVSRDHVVQAVLDGGFRGGATELRYPIRHSVDYHTKRQGRAKKLIKLRNGLVGLYEWDDAMFGPSTESGDPSNESENVEDPALTERKRTKRLPRSKA